MNAPKGKSNEPCRFTGELRIPPLAVTILFAAVMAGLDRLLPAARYEVAYSEVAAALAAVAGGALCGLGVWEFRRARTTVNPLRPETSSSLVTGGVYRMSRNPMYLGFLLLLAGWALFLSNAVAWVGPVALVFVLNRLQIIPEERMLTQRFGEAYRTYRARVRRWI